MKKFLAVVFIVFFGIAGSLAGQGFDKFHEYKDPVRGFRIQYCVRGDRVVLKLLDFYRGTVIFPLDVAVGKDFSVCFIDSGADAQNKSDFLADLFTWIKVEPPRGSVFVNQDGDSLLFKGFDEYEVMRLEPLSTSEGEYITGFEDVLEDGAVDCDTASDYEEAGMFASGSVQSTFSNDLNPSTSSGREVNIGGESIKLETLIYVVISLFILYVFYKVVDGFFSFLSSIFDSSVGEEDKEKKEERRRRYDEEERQRRENEERYYDEYRRNNDS